jgi:catechol 2,3-dioxygenase-like lactoylglutathione lyase family enzyme
MRILETCLYAENLAFTRRFYLEVLRMEEVMHAEDRMAVFRAGEGVLILFKASKTIIPDAGVPPHGAVGPGHMAFAATAHEIDVWAERLTDVGVRIEHKTWENGARSLYFRDPGGNVLEFAMPSVWD